MHLAQLLSGVVNGPDLSEVSGGVADTLWLETEGVLKCTQYNVHCFLSAQILKVDKVKAK
jgi:hypothetical protein